MGKIVDLTWTDSLIEMANQCLIRLDVIANGNDKESSEKAKKFLSDLRDNPISDEED